MVALTRAIGVVFCKLIPPPHFNELLRKITKTNETFCYLIFICVSRKVRNSFVQNNKRNVNVIQHSWEAALCLDTQWFWNRLVPFSLSAISIAQCPSEVWARIVSMKDILGAPFCFTFESREILSVTLKSVLLAVVVGFLFNISKFE